MKVQSAFNTAMDYVQIREKDLEGRELSALVEQLATLPQKSAARLLVNDRLDVARACGADGVHLPADSLPVAATRAAVGRSFVIGASCHSAQEVGQAEAAGAEYVLVAPVFDTASKPGIQPMGLSTFAEICRGTSIPVFALGGVDETNARPCIDAGAKGLAGIRLFQNSSDLAALCDRLRAL